MSLTVSRASLGKTQPVLQQAPIAAMRPASPTTRARRYTVGGPAATTVATAAVARPATPGSAPQHSLGGLASDSAALARSPLTSRSTVGLALFREAEEAMKKTPQAGSRPLILPLPTLAGQAREAAAAQEDDGEEGAVVTPKVVYRGRTIESIIDEKLAKVMDAIKNAPYVTQQRLEEVESRFGREITTLQAAWDAERGDSRTAIARLQAVVDEDREFQRKALHDLREGLAADAKASPSARSIAASDGGEAPDQHRELVMTLAAVCKDIEALQAEQGKHQHDIEVLLSQRFVGRTEDPGDGADATVSTVFELQADLDKTWEVQSRISKDVEELSSQVRSMERSKETGSQGSHVSALSSVEALSKLTETMRSQFAGEVKAVRAELMKDVDAVQRHHIEHGADIATLQGKQQATDDNLSALHASLPSAREVKLVCAKLMKDVDAVQCQQIAHGADIAALQEKLRATDEGLGALACSVRFVAPAKNHSQDHELDHEAAAGSATISEAPSALPLSSDATGSAVSRCSSNTTARRHFLAQPHPPRAATMPLAAAAAAAAAASAAAASVLSGSRESVSVRHQQFGGVTVPQWCQDY